MEKKQIMSMENCFNPITDIEAVDWKTAGVYLITNIKTKMIYVGSAKRINYRISNHKSYFKKGIHRNSKLQTHWNAYGEQSFVVSILQIVNDLSELASCEQKWIDQLNATDPNIGYNIQPAHRNNRYANHCINCKRPQKPLRKGRCHNCNEYLRRYGKERPYIENGRTETKIENDRKICLRCERPVTIAGYAAKGLCKSCYRYKQRVEKN